MDQTKNLNLELREMEKIKFVKIIRRFSSVQFQGQDLNVSDKRLQVDNGVLRIEISSDLGYTESSLGLTH